VILELKIEGTQRPLCLETRTGTILDRGRVAKDVRKVWATGWFDDIRVEASEGVAPTSPAAPFSSLGASGEYMSNRSSLSPIGGADGPRLGLGEGRSG
jgi:hypothetical protein